MTGADRLLVAIAVWAGVMAAVDGAVMIMRWMGAGEVTTVMAVFVVLVLAPFTYVDAIRAYGRHGRGGDGR